MRPLRTYRDDVASLIKKGGASYISMAVAAYQKGGSTAPSPANPRNLFFVVASGILVLLGIAAGAFVLFFREAPPQSAGITLAPLIFVESEEELDATGVGHEALMNNLFQKGKALDQKIGAITYVYLTELVPATESAPAAVKLMPASEYLRVIEARVSGAFLRALENNFLLGFHEVSGNKPFLILKTTSFNQAFAGMLAWEPYIRRDLAPVFGTAAVASSTPDSADIFRDRVIRNIDARALFNQDGTTALLYAFPNQEIIIITTNEATFNELLQRVITAGSRP